MMSMYESRESMPWYQSNDLELELWHAQAADYANYCVDQAALADEEYAAWLAAVDERADAGCVPVKVKGEGPW